MIGLTTHKNKFYFEAHETTFNSDKMISFMNHFADQTFKKTIVILNKSPIHKSKKFLAKIEEWNDKDIWIYFLQPYSQELNLIENYSGE